MWSRRTLLISLVLLAGCAGIGGQNGDSGTTTEEVWSETGTRVTEESPSESGAPELTVRARGDIEFRVTVSERGNDGATAAVNRTYALSAGEETTVHEALSVAPYEARVLVNDSVVWNRTLRPGMRVPLSIHSDGNVTVGPISSV